MSKEQMLSNVVEWNGKQSQNLYHFKWMITDWCNYDCAYCIVKEIMRDKWDKDESPSSYKLVLTKLEKFDGEFEIELFGGEPTLHPNMEDILLRLRSIPNCKNINIITNLSRPTSYFEKLNNLKLDNFLINASLHMEYYTPEFLEKIYKIKQMDHIFLGVAVNLSSNKEDWPTIVSIVKQLVAWGITPHLNFLQDMPFWQAKYDQEFYDLFTELQNTLPLTGYNKYKFGFKDGSVRELMSLDIHRNGYGKFTGFECETKFYDIDFEGNFSNTCTQKKVKTLLFKKHDLENKVICPRECCSCDVMFDTFKKRV